MISPVHKDLIKVRASQINGCDFCLEMHIKEANKLGEDEQRLHMLRYGDNRIYSTMKKK
ncbi:MAG: carboxymuconolactone decarboxylase family protein [Chitinophagales bacterium]|nr:carboxymuconolactone decarboxylase family protein [Chitinophagales bacterium]